MAKKQQSTQQPSRKEGEQQNEKLWDTPARPITPTPAQQPAQPPAQPPAQQPSQPAQPAKPVQQPSTEKK